MVSRLTFFIFSALLMNGCLQSQAYVVNLPQMNLQTKEAVISAKPASIDIQYPGAGLSTSKPEIVVVAVVNAAKNISTVTVYANDRLVKEIIPGGIADKIPLDVPVPLSLGQNVITIAAKTDAQKSILKKVSVTRTQAIANDGARPFANRWAVVVGISKYFFGGRGIPPLRFAHNDAKAFMDFLYSPQGGSFDPAFTRILINEDATSRNIRSALFTFLKKAKKDDLVVIYFAGHGAPEPSRPDNLYLITYDTDPNDLASTAFPMWDMETALKRYINAERVVIIADACHSAGVGSATGIRNIGNANLINSYLTNLQNTKPGRAIFTASEANQLSREGEEWDNHGVFTHFLLKGLKGAADFDDNGVITIAEAFKFTYGKVRRATDSQQHPNIQGKYDKNLPLGVVVSR